MKKQNIRNFVLVILLIFMGTGCKDFLKEESVSNITTNSYVVNEAGYEDLVKSCYPLLRDYILNYPLVLPGTDLFQAGNWNLKAIGDGPYLDQYDIRLNSSAGEVQSFWDILYRNIGRTNAAIDRAGDITYVDPAKKAARVAEAKFIRALSYFYIVQTWGDAPMPLTETVAADKVCGKGSSCWHIHPNILKTLPRQNLLFR